MLGAKSTDREVPWVLRRVQFNRETIQILITMDVAFRALPSVLVASGIWCCLECTDRPQSPQKRRTRKQNPLYTNLTI
jgi:hypothetical protein